MTPRTAARAGDREVAQSGSALALGARGRRFKSCLPDTGFNLMLKPQLQTQYSVGGSGRENFRGEILGQLAQWQSAKISVADNLAFQHDWLTVISHANDEVIGSNPILPTCRTKFNGYPYLIKTTVEQLLGGILQHDGTKHEGYLPLSMINTLTHSLAR